MTTVNKVIMGAVVLAIVLLILWLQGCDARRALGDQKRIEKGQTGAVIESSQDAINTASGVSANDVATSDLGRENERDIRNAEGSNVVVGNDASAGGVRALCKRQAYRERPECRVQ